MEDVKRQHSIRVLGAFGTKAKGFGTTSFMLNPTTTVDAGNLLDALEKESIEVENIWLTHSHLDHIVDIAYILDNYFSQRTKTLNIMGLPETIKAVKENFLNDTVWPDFSTIKLYGKDAMVVKYIEIEANKSYQISENETIRPFLTDHTVASCGYVYTIDNASVMITADTYSLDNVKNILETNPDIKSVIIECSFSNNMKTLALESKHLTSELLFAQLNSFKRDDFSLYINHIKPTYRQKIVEEIEAFRGKWKPIILKDEDFVYFR
ncbi:MBL fold metallo-hydrolase [Sulfurimonas paralvinellae]|uniref:MBL fold metallo-hydrolase n=1 Tax=Sulfurimonas paralvinellae TaxID=317658 RepID=A0A7M1B5S9_9BACT|nr:MBL fold metallo-hydrolase [Sulfurimonas paralvinellae]QOP44995.1 MBL fold metallo-hydrolase [Sulfurimonas paralvinellae]